jgi:hypothetical protein
MLRLNYYFIYIFVISSFLMGDLLKPSSGQFISYLHVLFEWEQEPDAEMYNIQVSSSSNFSNYILDLDTTKLTFIFEDEQIDWNGTYYWRVRPIYNDDSYGDWIETFLFRIRGSNTVSNPFETSIIDEDSIYNGLTIMGDLSDDNRSIVFDKNGKEIWNDFNKNFIMNHINKYGQISGCSFNNFPDNTGVVINYDNEYQWKGPDNLYIDVHEVKSIKNGNYMGFVQEYQEGPIPIGDWTNLYRALGYAADGETMEYPWFGQAIVEWDENSNEVWRWNPFDHFSMDDFDLYGGTWWNAYFDGQFDWMHSNAFYFDEEESVIYFSSRHLSRITKIDYPSGDIVWMIGMPSEYNTGDDNICTDLGFTWQHNVNLLENGNITLFDNGNLSGLFGQDATSRALEFRVIDNSYCEMIWEYTLPHWDTDQWDLFGPWMGSVQTLPNGNKLINTVGSGGHALEVTNNQNLVWYADYNITDNEEDPGGNYRTFRIPSLHPNAYSVIFDNYKTIDSEIGIYLSDNNLTLTITNESGYEQIYSYSMGDTEAWFDNILNEEIIINPYSSIELQFDANYNSEMTNFYFEIEPTYHSYDNKNYIFNVYRNQILGDINSDSTVNVLDVVILVSIILGNGEETLNSDVNLDGNINVLDVVNLINLILS